MARRIPRRLRPAPTRSSQRHSTSVRASVIGAFALASVGVFLLATDQAPGNANLFGKVLRKNKIFGGGLTANDYEKVLHRALASTDDLSAERVDYERIARRALAETSSLSRSLTSDNANYEIIKAAHKIQDENEGKVPFVFVMQATVGMIPMIKSWICNTATMENVHENTLLIVDEPGKKLLDDFEPAKGMHIVLDSLPEEMQGSWGFGTLGYWLATQNRFHTILDMIELGKVPVMIIEPDAVWLENPLDDPAITDSEADIVGFTDGDEGVGGIGFGFLRMKPTETVINLLTMAGESVDSTLKAASKKGEDDPSFFVGKVTGEQDFFSRLIWSFRQEHPDVKLIDVLPGCLYPSGAWYMKPKADNEKCREKALGPMVVLQNNWIMGNENKISRAKSWGHWFLAEEEDQCLRTDLAIARLSVESGSANPKPEEEGGTNPEPDDDSSSKPEHEEEEDSTSEAEPKELHKGVEVIDLAEK